MFTPTAITQLPNAAARSTAWMTSAFVLLAFAVTLASASGLAIAQAKPDSHVGDCSKREGLEQLRCERHEKMFAKCGPIKGPAHHMCDREFLIANPLDCSKAKTADKKACEAELTAMKTCASNEGREFVKCIVKETGQSPMGH